MTESIGEIEQQQAGELSQHDVMFYDADSGTVLCRCHGIGQLALLVAQR